MNALILVGLLASANAVAQPAGAPTSPLIPQAVAKAAPSTSGRPGRVESSAIQWREPDPELSGFAEL